MLKADTARNRLLGIGLVSITFVCFAVLDTTAKWLVRTLPVVEVVWLRFVGHVLFTGLLLAPRHGRELLRATHPKLQLLRGEKPTAQVPPPRVIARESSRQLAA